MTSPEPATAAQPAASAPDRILNPQTGMDAVTLRVGDLELMSSYYADALALQPLEERAVSRHIHDRISKRRVNRGHLAVTRDRRVAQRGSGRNIGGEEGEVTDRPAILRDIANDTPVVVASQDMAWANSFKATMVRLG